MKTKTDHPTTSNAQPARNRGSVFELLSSLVLLGGPIFYVLGRVYLEAYWSALNVPPSLMAVDAEDYLFFGFAFIVNGLVMFTPKSGVNTVWIAPIVSIIALAAVGFCVWIVHRIRSTLRRKLQKTLARLRNYCVKRRSAVEALSVSASLLSNVCVGLIALLTLWLALLVPIGLASSVGRWRAERVRSDMAAADRTAHIAATTTKVPDGRLVECTDTWCVVYTSGKFTPVPQSEVQFEHRHQ